MIVCADCFMLYPEEGEVIFFIESNLSSSIIDQPGHFITPLLGENQLGKPETHHKLESVLLTDLNYADKAASVRNIDTCPTKADATACIPARPLRVCIP